VAISEIVVDAIEATEAIEATAVGAVEDAATKHAIKKSNLVLHAVNSWREGMSFFLVLMTLLNIKKKSLRCYDGKM